MLRHEIHKESEINTQKQDNSKEITKVEIPLENGLLEKTGHQKNIQNKNVIRQENLIQQRQPVLGENLITADNNSNGTRIFNYPAQNTNNCFACAGAAIYNRFIRGDKGASKLDQYKVRGFVPNFLSSKELAKQTGQVEDNNTWQLQVSEILNFSGKNRAGYGDFFSLSDVIHEKKNNGGCGRKDIAVHKMVFLLKDQPQDKVNAQVEIIKEKLHKILEKDQMAMLKSFDHYLTITGLDDNTITFLDSLSDKDHPHNPNEERSMDIHDFLKKLGELDGYDTTELLWLSNVTENSKQKLFKEFENMGQDPKTGEIVRKENLTVGADDVSHRAGIVIVKTQKQLNDEGYSDVEGLVTEVMAIHRYAFGEEPGEILIEEEQEEEIQEEEQEEKKQEEKKQDPEIIAKESKILESFEKSTRDIFAAGSKAINNAQNQEIAVSVPLVSDVIKFDRKWNKEKRSEEETDLKITDASSELHKKAAFSKRLEDKFKENADKYAQIRKGLSNDVRSLLGFEDLKELSCFFIGDAKANENLVRLVSGKLNFENGDSKEATKEVQKKMHYAALDIMTDQLKSFLINDIDLTNDNGILNNFDKLYELSQKLGAYRKLLDKEPDYIKERKEKFSGQEYLALKKKFRILSAIDDYFTARCMVLRHPVYLRRYDSEIGVIYSDTQSGQEKEFSKLLICMRSAARNLNLRVGSTDSKKCKDLAQGINNGKDSFDSFISFFDGQEELIQKSKKSLGFQKDISVFRNRSDYKRRIQSLKRGAYAGRGGIDYSDCKAETVNDFMTTLDNFYNAHKLLTKKDVKEQRRAYLAATNGAPEQVINLFDMYRKIHENGSGNDFSVLVSEGYLSSKELTELTEGLSLNDDSGIALNNAQQDLYLSSMSTIIKCQFDLANRFLETYGSYPEQLSQPLFIAILTKEGKGAEFTGRLMSAAKLSELTQKTISINGKEKSVIDELVERELISDDFADKIRGVAKLIDGYKGIHEGGVDSLVNLAVGKNDQDEADALAKLSKESYEKTHALIVSYFTGYGLNIKQYSEQSVILRKVPSTYKKFFKGYEEGRLRTTKAKYIKKFLLFDSRLRGVEGGGRSEAYNSFRRTFINLSTTLIDIGESKTEDGKSLDPENVTILRNLYDDCIKKANDYLSGKTINENIEVGVSTDQDRYRITREIATLLRNDLDKLLSLDYDKNYSIDEAFSEERYKDAKGKILPNDEAASFIIADVLGIEKDRAGLDKLPENEGDIIRHLSDINVFSYILGKTKLPGDSKENGSLKAVPTTDKMLVIDEKTANRIMHLEKRYLFFKLGRVMTQQNKNALWSRIETMQKEILAAQTEGESKNLQIVSIDDFKNLSLLELSKASGGKGLFAEMAKNEKVEGRLTDHHKGDLAYRFECDELKVETDMPRLVEGQNEDFIRALFASSRQFNEKIGSLFNRTRTSNAVGNLNMIYEDSKAFGFMPERLNVFGSGEYAEYGVKSVMDIFYIDGKRAANVLGTKVEQYTASAARYLGPDTTKQQLDAIRDMAFKALLMDVLVAGEKQVTIANFQMQMDGSVVPVVTDLDAGFNIINKSRKSRQQRFRNIRKDMYERKSLAKEVIAKQIHDKAKNKAGYVGFDRAASVFLDRDEKKRSDEFKALKRAILQFYRTVEDPDNVELNAKTYPVILKLYNAASLYHAKHITAVFQKGFYQQAANIMKFMSKIAGKLTDKRLADQLAAPVNVDPEEKNNADLNISECAESYFRYCQYISRDTISTEPEKLTKKWDMLKRIERDIQIIAKKNPYKVKNDIMVSALVNEYKTVKLNMALLKKAQAKEGMEDALSNYRSKFVAEKSVELSGSTRKIVNKDHTEYGISNAQMSNIRQIDQWLLRNFRNGGYMRAFGLHTDRSNILSEIMKKSPRERLYIYYIVENSEARKKPNAYDAATAQLYTPNLGTFKKNMVANWLKFYSRFSGGYVYWHKLSQALAICEGYGEVIDSMDNYYRQIKADSENGVKKDKADSNEISTVKKEKPKPKDETEKHINEYLDSLGPVIQIFLQIQVLEDKKKDKSLNDNEYTSQMDELSKKLKEESLIIQKLPSLSPIMLEDFKKRKIVTDAEDKTAVEKGFKEAKDIGDNIKYAGTIGCLTEAISSFDFLKSGFFSFMKGYGSASEKGIGSIGSVIGCLFTIKDLLENWKIIRTMDRVQNISGMTINVVRLLQSVLAYTDASKISGTFSSAMLGTTAGVALAAGDAAVTGFKTWFHYKNGSGRIEASKLASKVRDKDRTEYLETGKAKDQRYREGIVRLNRLLGKKQKIETGSSIVGTTASVFAAVSLFTTLITGAAATIPALIINLLASFGTIKWTSHVTKEMRREIDAAFFNADEMMKVAKKDYLNENGVPMSQKQEEKLKKVILKRIAASHGYYSPSHMANAVAGSFAKYLVEGAKDSGDEGRMCVDMIKGFGLKVTQNPLTREVISPTVSDISKKMCG